MCARFSSEAGFFCTGGSSSSHSRTRLGPTEGGPSLERSAAAASAAARAEAGAGAPLAMPPLAGGSAWGWYCWWG